MPCPNNPAPAYGGFAPPKVFYDPSTPNNVSAANPSFPTPKQGQCFSNCPLMAALDSIAWVNRKFIVNNITGPDAGGNYTFTFWDYGQNNPMTGVLGMMSTNSTNIGANVPLNGVLNPVLNNAACCTKAQVTVSGQVLLDGGGNFSDGNGIPYGAGSSIANEMWPALFEKAYAKFCFYENNMPLLGGIYLNSVHGHDANGNPVNIINGPDPSYADLLMLGNGPAAPATNYWGGNAGIGLAYLTGRLCFQYSTAAAAYAVPELSHLPAGAAGNSLYNFIKAGFCSAAQGNHKTRWPLVAWTYPAGNQFNPDSTQGIVAGHCYAILGTFDAANGCNDGNKYIVLRTTYGLSDPLALAQTAPAGTGWQYNDEGFPFPGTAAAPAAGGALKNLNLTILTDAIFGLNAAVFSNYFQSIAWAETYY